MRSTANPTLLALAGLNVMLVVTMVIAIAILLSGPDTGAALPLFGVAAAVVPFFLLVRS